MLVEVNSYHNTVRGIDPTLRTYYDLSACPHATELKRRRVLWDDNGVGAHVVSCYSIVTMMEVVKLEK